MSNGLHILIANERIAEMRRSAERSRLGKAARAERRQRLTAITLRRGEPDDARALYGLAQLDSAEPLAGETILAVVSGQIVAAMSPADGRVIASPFTRTNDAVALLRLWASQGSERRHRARPRLRLRAA